jgi:hypothetical protein
LSTAFSHWSKADKPTGKIGEDPDDVGRGGEILQEKQERPHKGVGGEGVETREFLLYAVLYLAVLGLDGTVIIRTTERRRWLKPIQYFFRGR